MKKISIILFTALVLSVSLTSCSAATGLFTREYAGEKIAELVFEKIDYMSAEKITYRIDFTSNTVYRKKYDPSMKYPDLLTEEELNSDDYNNNDIFVNINSFTEEEEKAFIDACYSHGLFGIRKKYEKNNVDDGGGWILDIKYENGDSKTSVGSNDSPSRIFDNCAVLFFDLCGEQVLGSLPQTFKSPPNLSVAFSYTKGNNSVSTNEGFQIFRMDYYWNEGRFVSDRNDFYSINGELERFPFEAGITYEAVFYTANYRDYDKFSKFILKSYDYNEEMTGETTVAELGWFKQEEFILELNKIYVYELQFKNGEYVRYTFNTKV